MARLDRSPRSDRGSCFQALCARYNLVASWGTGSYGARLGASGPGVMFRVKEKNWWLLTYFPKEKEYKTIFMSGPCRGLREALKLARQELSTIYQPIGISPCLPPDDHPPAGKQAN